MDLLFAGLSILPIALLVLLVVVLLVGRGEPDATGRRVYAAYLFVVVFITMIVVLASAAAVIGELASGAPETPQLDEFGFPTDPGPSGFPTPLDPGFDADAQRWRTVLQSLTIALAAGTVLVFHALRARTLIRQTPDRADAAWRSFRIYIHATCLVAIVTALFAGANAVYSLIRVIAPGLTAFGSESAERDAAVESLVTSGFIAIVAGLVFVRHWMMRERSLAVPPPPPTAAATTV